VAPWRSTPSTSTASLNSRNELLWWERGLRSVANFTRADAREFLDLAAAIPIRTETQLFGLAEGNDALRRLAAGELEATAVLVMGGGAQ
jgi:propanol-preferring alcohol dehydrogenase